MERMPQFYDSMRPGERSERTFQAHHFSAKSAKEDAGV